MLISKAYSTRGSKEPESLSLVYVHIQQSTFSNIGDNNKIHNKNIKGQ